MYLLQCGLRQTSLAIYHGAQEEDMCDIVFLSLSSNYNGGTTTNKFVEDGNVLFVLKCPKIILFLYHIKYGRQYAV